MCFLGSAAVAVAFNVPPRALWVCGVLGNVAWSGELFLRTHGDSMLAANFSAALIVAMLAELAARVQRLPVTCFAVPGVIPLVPGFSLYKAMYGFVMNQIAIADTDLMDALLIAGAIAAALVIAGSVVNLLPGQARSGSQKGDLASDPVVDEPSGRVRHGHGSAASR